MSNHDELPITPLLPAILASLDAHPRLVLEAPPGAGKTTRVPLALAAAPWCGGRVLVLEPRRVAARAAAGAMAAARGEEVGAGVGYRIRFETRVSARTRVEIITEGILTRMLQDDPTLDGVSALVFDEFHERNLASDLGLAFALDVQAGLRPDLRLVVMSATLDGERLAHFLDCPRLTATGRSHPVTVAWQAARPQERLEHQVRRAVDRALAENPGDVLVFLPGKAEIARCARLLQTDAGGAECVELHGELDIAAQSRALAPGTRRRVVLATNVAESSVTLPGVRAVVDSGLAREPRFDAASGMSRLVTVTITQASATQRAGRAGRLGPGACYRLWPQGERLDPTTRPELQQVELSAFALELAAWGSSELRFLDPPPPGALAQARELLRDLGALDGAGRITAHGRALLALGLPPRLANAVLRAPAAERALACDLAALLEGRDPLRGEARRSDDLRERVAALGAYRARRGGAEVDRHALAAIDQAARQWRQRAGVDGAGGTVGPLTVGNLLAHAFPDRIARRERDDAFRYRLASGRGARLGEHSALAGEPWLLVTALRFDARDSLVLLAAPLEEALLGRDFAARHVQARERRFNAASLTVEALEERRFAAIVLERRAVPAPRDADTAGALAAGLQAVGLAALPWTESLRQWQARVVNLRAWCPELGLPDVTDEALAATAADWLPMLCAGRARVADIEPGHLAAILEQQLDHAARRALDDHAPTAVVVPSGQRRALTYAVGEAPVLAVKLQELFGLADGPRVAKGRVPVVLHLLSPRQAPIQVTRDLRGFWERTYPEVRRELMGRYPRHPWPLDPWSAVPTHRAKPRQR